MYLKSAPGRYSSDLAGSPEWRVNYESAWTRDIFLSGLRREMLVRPGELPNVSKGNYLDDVHVRMLRVTEDLRVIQRELNCAAMQAPGDPELMEALSQLPEIESLEMLKSALDQMRHFLWFYVQVMTTGSEIEEAQQRPAKAQTAKDVEFVRKYKSLTETAILQHYADIKNRKPN
jgi:hypothetical protein